MLRRSATTDRICVYPCACSRGSVVVHSRVDVLLELLEAAMRDEGGLITSRSALRYLMTLISREFSRQTDRRGGTSTSESCTAVKSLRIVDPSIPSTGLCSRCVISSTTRIMQNSTGFSDILNSSVFCYGFCNSFLFSISCGTLSRTPVVFECWLIIDHPRSSVVYNFSRVCRCIYVCLSVRR